MRTTPSWRSVFGVALCVALAAAVLSACGSDEETGVSGGGEETAIAEMDAATDAATGVAYEIGLICGCTGALASSLGEIPELVEVWEQATNDSGGISGHPVKVLVEDDQADPSKAGTAARTLVQDGVQAVVSNFSTTAEIYTPYFESQKVPQIGGITSDLKRELSPNFFPSGGNIAGRDFGIVKSAKDAGKSKLGVFYCAEYPSCASVGDLYSNIAEATGGIEVVAEGSMSATAPNYIPQCLKVKDAGVDSLYIQNAAPPVIKMLSDCQQQGVETLTLEQNAIATPEMAESSAAEGMKVMYGNPVASDASTPGGKYLNESIEKYSPDLMDSPNWNESLTAVWAGLELFKKVAEQGKLTPESSTEDVYAALYEVKDETIDGLSPPLTFEAGKARNIPCWYSGTVEGGKIVSDGSEFECTPPDIVPIIEAGRGL